jgi:hypothetical protein
MAGSGMTTVTARRSRVEGTETIGFHPHPPSLFHRGLAKTLGAGMWFFIFYRAR